MVPSTRVGQAAPKCLQLQLQRIRRPLLASSCPELSCSCIYPHIHTQLKQVFKNKQVNKRLQIGWIYLHPEVLGLVARSCNPVPRRRLRAQGQTGLPSEILPMSHTGVTSRWAIGSIIGATRQTPANQTNKKTQKAKTEKVSDLELAKFLKIQKAPILEGKNG